MSIEAFDLIWKCVVVGLAAIIAFGIVRAFLDFFSHRPAAPRRLNRYERQLFGWGCMSVLLAVMGGLYFFVVTPSPVPGLFAASPRFAHYFVSALMALGVVFMVPAIVKLYKTRKNKGIVN